MQRNLVKFRCDNRIGFHLMFRFFEVVDDFRRSRVLWFLWSLKQWLTRIYSLIDQTFSTVAFCRSYLYYYLFGILEFDIHILRRYWCNLPKCVIRASTISMVLTRKRLGVNNYKIWKIHQTESHYGLVYLCQCKYEIFANRAKCLFANFWHINYVRRWFRRK